MRDPVKRIEPLVLAGSLLVLVALIALRATASGKRLAAAPRTGSVKPIALTAV